MAARARVKLGRTLFSSVTWSVSACAKLSLALLCAASIAAQNPVPAGALLSKARAGTAAAAIPQADSRPQSSLALSPAVIMLNAQAGQSTTQKLTISNLTPSSFDFSLEAMDVAVRDGKRVFVTARELPGSIAGTAIFSPATLHVPAGASSTVMITVTVPHHPATRAIVAIFRSKTVMQGTGGVAMSASMGTLLTFTLSKSFLLKSSGVRFEGTSEGAELMISEGVMNTGDEPAVAKGIVAILRSSGSLVGKVPIEGGRLLPGESLQFKTEYPSTLKAGKYRALISLEHEGGVLTTASEFEIQ
jgi:hypothetical protein